MFRLLLKVVPDLVILFVLHTIGIVESGGFLELTQDCLLIDLGEIQELKLRGGHRIERQR